MTSRPLASYFLTLAIGWLLLAAAAAVYAGQKDIPASMAVPIAAAFLFEFAFYLIPGFEVVRRKLSDEIPIVPLASGMWLSTLIPYTIATLPTGVFNPDHLFKLALLTGFVTFWFVFRPPSGQSDAVMICILALTLLTKFFKRIYDSPIDERIDILGQVMLIRLAAFVFLEFRQVKAVRFGFIPNAEEWKAGFRYFLMFLPIGVPLSWILGVVEWNPTQEDLWRAPLQFLGALWVVALSEEFFFRGLIQRWLTEWSRREHLSLLAASVLFGLAHLSFRFFPNWRFAIVVMVAGWFYGKVFIATGSIRPAMVSHALVVTLWQTLFR